MVSFSVDGSTVKIYVNSGTGVNKPYFVFSCQASNEATAQILRIHFADQLNRLVEDIRRTNYETGWKHAKGRRAKRRFFPSSLRIFDADRK